MHRTARNEYAANVLLSMLKPTRPGGEVSMSEVVYLHCNWREGFYAVKHERLLAVKHIYYIYSMLYGCSAHRGRVAKRRVRMGVGAYVGYRCRIPGDCQTITEQHQCAHGFLPSQGGSSSGLPLVIYILDRLDLSSMVLIK